jgi:hypothetical protein
VNDAGAQPRRAICGDFAEKKSATWKRQAEAEITPILVHNPLASFVSVWISGKGRALLLPPLSSATG